MKRKEFTIANVGVIGLMLFFGLLTVNLSVNQDLFSMIKQQVMQPGVASADTAGPAKSEHCSPTPPLKLTGTDPDVLKLAQYQQLCNSFVTSKMMYFTGFSETKADAAANATVVAAKLRAFQQAGITPIVIAEPYLASAPMSYQAYMSGAYDKAQDHFFAKLKAAGITDQMMGIWVPFPESNTPSWNNVGTTPNDFALCVNRYMSVLKKYFPTTPGSVLLNSMTYDPTDTEWNNGDYLSLIPYLQNIDKTLVSSIGIQGFPWVSKATTKRSEIFRASEFLQPDLAIAAAQELHTRDIWFNTGTFAAKYTTDRPNTVQISATERKAILDDILAQVKQVQDYQESQYRVSINLFSQDKSQATEATDWSYFQNQDSKTILVDFLQKAQQESLPVSLFDH